MSRNTGIDGNVLINAVKHRANYKPIIFCSISLAAIGMLMAVLGMVIMMIDHVELGPPHYDSQYERYEGSNLAHITGPMFIGFGSFLILGNIIMLGYATRSYYQNINNLNTDVNNNTSVNVSPLMMKQREEFHIEA